MENLLQIGLALLVLGIVLISIGGLSGKGETKMAVGGFIGFIPFGFSNDPKLARALMMLMTGMFIVLVLLRIGRGH